MKDRNEKTRESTKRLADEIRRIMSERNLNAVEVAHHARGRGHKLSGGYLGKVMNLEVTSPSLDRIEAMAAGLGVSPIQLCRAAYGLKDEAAPEELTDLGDKMLQMEEADESFFRELIRTIDLEADRRLRRVK